MRWKQFFSPVKSIDTRQAQQMLAETNAGLLTILDVRQPREYQSSHLPGATLIPLPELNARLAELDPKRSVLVY